MFSKLFRRISKFLVAILVCTLAFTSTPPIVSEGTGNTLRVLVEPTLVFNKVYAFYDGMAQVYLQDDKMAYVNTDGQIVFEWDTNTMGTPYERYGAGFIYGIMLVEKNGKYGFIDKTGNVVIDFEYDYAMRITDNYIYVEKGGKAGFFNEKTREVKLYSGNYDQTCYYSYPVDEESYLPMSKIIILKKGDSWGIFDVAGNEVFPLDFTLSNLTLPSNSTIGRDYVSYKILKIDKDGKKGAMDRTGEVLIPPEYDEVDITSNRFNYDTVPVSKSSKWGLYNIVTNKLVLDTIYNWIEPFSAPAKDTLRAYVDPSYVYVDSKTGDILTSDTRIRAGTGEHIETKIEVHLTAEQLAFLKPLEDALVAYNMDAALPILVSPTFQEICRSLPKENGNTYKYDSHGEWMLAYFPQTGSGANFQIGLITDWYNGQIFLAESYLRDGVIDSGEMMYHNIVNGEMSDILRNPEVLPSPKYLEILSFSNGMGLVSNGTNSGYIDYDGNIIVPLQYDNVSLSSARTYEFDESGLAIVSLNGKKGVIDKTGKIIVPTEYDFILRNDFGYFTLYHPNSFKMGVATGDGMIIMPTDDSSIASRFANYVIIRKDDKRGLQSLADGEFTIPIEYESLDWFDPSSNLLIASKAGKTGIINANGDIVFPFGYELISPAISERDTPLGYDGKYKYDYLWIKDNGKFGIATLENQVANEAILSINPSGQHSFTAVQEGYSTPAALSVTVTNAGTSKLNAITVTKGGINADAFIVNSSALPSEMAANANGVFTVTPAKGLAKGVYTAVIKVSAIGDRNSGTTSKTLAISMTVNEKAVVNPPSGGGGTPSGGSGSGGSGTVTKPPVTSPVTTSSSVSTPVSSAVQSQPQTQQSALGFSDVNMSSWFYQAVSVIVQRGLMNGISASEFSPNSPTTRAMLVTVLYRNEGEPPVEAGSSFTDVAAGKWYTDAIQWASSNGIVTGFENNLFKSDEDISREQIASIIYRYAQYKNQAMPQGVDLASYTDSAQVSDWALPAMKWAVAKGIINGRSESVLAPQEKASRAEVATMLYRFLAI